MKKILAFLILGINLIHFTSAYMPYSNFDVSIPIVGLIFIIISAIINFSLMKSKFLDDKTTRLIVSFSASALAIFWAIKKGISFERFFSNLGILDFIIQISPLLFLIALGIALWKLKVGKTVMLLGGLFFLIGLIGSITDTVYNWEISIVIGLILVGIGFFIRKKFGKKKPEQENNL